MIFWEYKVLAINEFLADTDGRTIGSTAILNEYGLQGWELVAVYDGYAYLKRERKL